MTDPTTGQQVVSGMEFGPGSKVSPDDLKQSMFMRSDREIADQVEADRAVFAPLHKAEMEYARTKELEAGAPLTVEERTQQLISQYNMIPQQAQVAAQREAEGRGTPFLDNLISGRGDFRSELDRASRREVGRPSPEKDDYYDDPRYDELSPKSGDLAEGIPRGMRGKPVKKPYGAFAAERPPMDPDGKYSKTLRDAAEFPTDPFRSSAGTFIGPGAAARMVTSEIAGDALLEALATNKPAELIAKHRIYVEAVRARGHEDAARDLEETRKVAFAQEAREKAEFVRAMVPELRASRVADPEGLANLYYEDPEQAAIVHKEAAALVRQHAANIPRLAQLAEKKRQAKAAGEARRDLEASQAREDFGGRVDFGIQALEGEDVKSNKDIEDYRSQYMKVLDKASSGAALSLSGLDLKGLLPGDVLSGNFGSLSPADAEAVQRQVIDRIASDAEAYGLTGDDISSFQESRVRAMRARESLDRTYTTKQVLATERDMVNANEDPGDTIPVRERATDGWGRTTGDGTASTQSTFSSGKRPPMVDRNNMGTGFGGGMSFEQGIDAAGTAQQVEDATLAGTITEAAIFTGKTDPLVPKSGGRKTAPPPSGDQVRAYSARLQGPPYNMSSADADATAFATAATPDKFWAEVRRSPRSGGPDTPKNPLIDDPRGTPPPAGVGYRPGADYPDGYNEDYEKKAYDAGLRKDGPYGGWDLDGKPVTNKLVLNRYGD